RSVPPRCGTGRRKACSRRVETPSPRLAPTPPPTSATPASSTSSAAPATASPTCAPCSPTCGAPAPARTCWTGVRRRWTCALVRCWPLPPTCSRSAKAYPSLARTITAAITPADLLTRGGSGCTGQALGELPGAAGQVGRVEHLEVVPEQCDVQQDEVQVLRPGAHLTARLVPVQHDGGARRDLFSYRGRRGLHEESRLARVPAAGHPLLHVGGRLRCIQIGRAHV